MYIARVVRNKKRQICVDCFLLHLTLLQELRRSRRYSSPRSETSTGSFLSIHRRVHKRDKPAVTRESTNAFSTCFEIRRRSKNRAQKVRCLEHPRKIDSEQLRVRCRRRSELYQIVRNRALLPSMSPWSLLGKMTGTSIGRGERLIRATQNMEILPAYCTYDPMRDGEVCLTRRKQS